MLEDDDENNEKKLIEKLKQGMRLLQENYLGGSGTRGYGKIEFKNLKSQVVFPPKIEDEKDFDL